MTAGIQHPAAAGADEKMMSAWNEPIIFYEATFIGFLNRTWPAGTTKPQVRSLREPFLKSRY